MKDRKKTEREAERLKKREREYRSRWREIESARGKIKGYIILCTVNEMERERDEDPQCQRLSMGNPDD